MGVGGQRHVPAALPPGMTRYPLYRRLGRPQGRSGRVRKISPPPGFDPRTVRFEVEQWCIIKMKTKVFMTALELKRGLVSEVREQYRTSMHSLITTLPTRVAVVG
jgi:hypothetical protein